MGLAGGPHCVAMCGAACAGIGQAAGAARGRALLSFQAGRIVGYAGLGALAAASMQGLGWLTVQSVALRPLWTFIHIAAIALGLLLLWHARQPPWLETLGRFLWTRAQSLGLHRGAAPGLVGMLWALLPCGLLYSAVMVSALAGSVAGGALLMALFALGSGITMLAGPWLWLRWVARRTLPADCAKPPTGLPLHAGSGNRGSTDASAPLVFHPAGILLNSLTGHLTAMKALVAPAPTAAARGDWGVRLAGAALACSAAWALWMDLAHNAAPWCVVA